MPIGDAPIDWPQNQSLYRAIGKIVIPAQEAFSPTRRAYVNDILSYNSFHCPPEHLPLGSINRVRIKAYKSSTTYRWYMNATPRIEPRAITDLPN